MTFRLIALATVAALQFSAGAAHAQILDQLKGQLGGGESQGATSGGGILGGLGGGGALPSLSAGSTGNVAGVLEFCVKNNYLGGGDAASVKDKLLGKLGGKPESDSGYLDGAKGILTGGDGKKLDLSGGGLKAKLTEQACDKILSQGKSLL